MKQHILNDDKPTHFVSNQTDQSIEIPLHIRAHVALIIPHTHKEKERKPNTEIWDLSWSSIFSKEKR